MAFREAVHIRERRIGRRWVTILAPALALLLSSGPAPAQEDGGEMVDAEISGQVVDALDIGVEGVTVKLFRGSFFVTETTTDIDGNYSLPFQFNASLDKSLVVWFLPQDAALVPELLVLRESFQSKELKLLSPCLPRVQLDTQITYNVTLQDEKAKLSSLSASECFKSKS